MIDFTHCNINPLKTYGGANGSKICISHEDRWYMLKFPPHPSSNKEISYTNSCISEHIGSSIFNLIGIEAQKTILGSYTINGVAKTVVACEDFCQDGERLSSFIEMKNAVIDSPTNGAGTNLSDILDAIDNQRLYDPVELKHHFWRIFIVDALTGNFDRNNYNWGLLINDSTQNVRLAPVFDNGSCLYPQLSDEDMLRILDNEDEILNRVYVFPNSIFKIDDRKIGYLEYLTSPNADPVCIDELHSIVPRINIREITDFIHNLEISATKKNFFCRILTERKTRILDEACKQTLH